MPKGSSIDLAKALAITSVVLGHVLETRVLAGGGLTEAVAYRWIYAFHMPFWFLLSGFLYRGAEDPRSFFTRKWRHLILPYLAWLVVFNAKALAGLGVNLVRGMTDEKWQFYRDHFYKQACGGEWVGGAQMVLWFPVCLFFSQQAANLLFRKIPNPGTRGAIVSVIFALGYANQFLAPDFRLPLALNVVAGALPFFVIGHHLRGPRPRWLAPSAAIAALAVLLAIALLQWPLHYHMRMAEYGWPVISTLGATGAFLAVLRLSEHTATKAAGFRLPTAIGTASMTIMYLHVVFLSLMARAGVTSWILLLIGGIALPTAIHALLDRSLPLRRWFLGADTAKASLPAPARSPADS